ncbi:PQQ-dependent sugar dehydrogenase [Kibdelosporangium philippinense]|uniref:PQQ-dependent sugar dehydrogenase n=1 Tax=Kibdelosporangium philippinense TaxID=211113 RepID=A0ABS8ZFS1_9PSEU|nr:PQQ-dependent sugar dehydrogenase [Kibdelosporangium philippinense]MCE7006675.1 PQQ-dependent sugar dehydrogenase [Kibdelosporangium philippinense]
MWTRRAGAAVTAAAAMFGGVVATSPVAQAAPALPSGFVLVDTPTGQQAGTLTDVAFLPDGSTLTTGRLGSVQWAPQGGQPVQIASLPVYTAGSLGLTSIAVAPDYATTRTVYTTQAVSTGGTTKAFRVSKWRTLGTNEPTGLVDEAVVLEFQGKADNKGIQDVVVEPALGPDATKTALWIAVGDNSTVRSVDGATKDNVDPYALNALDINQPTGKILRVWPDGRGIESNPFFTTENPNSWSSRNYLSGLRHPRLTLDPRGGVIVTDTGWAARDEVNLAFPGQNMKWPCWEGTTQTPAYKDLPACANVANNAPLHEVNRGTATTTMFVGGLPYTGTSYPEAYRGAHFLADRNAHTLSTLKYDAAGKVTQTATVFATDIGDPVSAATAPNGDIVIADAATSILRRVSYKPANKGPTAGFEFSVDRDSKKISVNAGMSFDPDREALTYQWNFGDGSTGTGKLTEHTYAAGAGVTVTLTVTDPHGATNTKSQLVIPGEESPQLPLTTPGPEAVFSVNETIAVSAEDARDSVDGPIAVEWKADRVRCLRDRSCEITQLHTGSGPNFSMKFPNEADGRVIITASATNSRGVPVTRQYVANPRLTRFGLTSTHNAQYRVGSSNEAANRMVTAGSTVVFEPPQTALEGAATFSKWIDNLSPNRIRQITVPAGGITLNAEYVSPIHKRYTNEPILREWMGEPVGMELHESNSHWQQYARGRVYWTAAHGLAETHGAIYAKYVALGGHRFLGAPSTDEQRPPDVIGYYNHFVGGPGTGVGSIYHHPTLGTFEIHGEMRAKWAALGYETSYLGYPTSDSHATNPAGGFYNRFERGSIFYSDATGAHNVQGAIHDKWAALGYERSYLGYPTTDDTATSPAGGFYNRFQRGSIYYSDATGAHNVQGAIHDKWASLGYENSFIGYPTTDDTATNPAGGFYNHFQRGSIFYSDATGAHNVQGAIQARYAALGYERSYLGYPTVSDRAVSGGYQSDFQNGYIFYNSTTDEVIDRRY